MNQGMYVLNSYGQAGEITDVPFAVVRTLQPGGKKYVLHGIHTALQ